MSKEQLTHFKEPLRVELDNKSNALTLLDNFVYVIHDYKEQGYQEIIVVPKGFVSTASNLNGFRLGRFGNLLKISIMHEYLYYLADRYNSKANYSKAEADELMLQALKNNRCNIVKAYSVIFLVKFIRFVEKSKWAFFRVFKISPKLSQKFVDIAKS